MAPKFPNRLFERLKHRVFGSRGGPPEEAESYQTPRKEETAPIDIQALTAYADQKSEEVADRKARLEASPEPDLDITELEKKVVQILETVYDPEIPVNIHALGLIYETRIEPSGMAHVKMTLTSPNCPAAATLPAEVESKVRSVPGVKDVVLSLVFEPSWNPDMMSEAAKLELGML